MQKIKKLAIYLSIFLMFIVPTLSFAKGLVNCTDGKLCDFNKLMDLINIVIRFVLYDMVIPIAAIMFAYAGFEMIISGGDSGARTKAKNTFTNVVIGLIIAVAAFLIVRTILSILGYQQGSWIGFNPF